jgi:4-oxalomesaconate tautomerase
VRIPLLVMRGGTSKGAYFLASDLPADEAARDDLLLAVMGSPDPRQIDGIGGAHPLTSKVAVISPSERPGIDVDYLFLQVQVDAPVVSAEQPCGNILAGVGPFAIERGLVQVKGPVTPVTVRMVNTGAVAVIHVPTPDGEVRYDGTTAIKTECPAPPPGCSSSSATPPARSPCRCCRPATWSTTSTAWR